MPIPIIDLFAGPGGLGEGFSALRRNEKHVFRIKLSIEKDPHAHRTLELRAFFRNFSDGLAPEDYYNYLRGIISREQLFEKFPNEAKAARHEAWNATLGSPQLPKAEIDRRIRSALGDEKSWVLIGGPPCQAYSLVGRSRVIGKKGGQAKYDADPRHTLYRQYLRILAIHQPPVFVMENVKGLLSAKRREEHIFERMRDDLQRPGISVRDIPRNEKLEYRLLSLVKRTDADSHEPGDFVVHAEKYGIPQARHRVILLGIRSDVPLQPELLAEVTERFTVAEAIGDLPKLRSGISKAQDSPELWRAAISEILNSRWIQNGSMDQQLREALRREATRLKDNLDRGAEFIAATIAPPAWYIDQRLKGVCNHTSRGHIQSDLRRYFFCAVFAREKKRAPLLEDFPKAILPDHKNVEDALKETKFNDRFRVQLQDRPSTTVVSHIAKDGHYYIHYDPAQCRSLTVREAARLQTFPDNYFFEGPRTEQYKQVGNAVPPMLANQIASITAGLFR